MKDKAIGGFVMVQIRGIKKMKLGRNTARVLKYLQTHNGITSMEAFELFGATRLSAIIFNLRKYGFEIENIPMQGKNRYGDSVNFVKYHLINK